MHSEDEQSIDLRAPAADAVDGRLDDGRHGRIRDDTSPHELAVAVPNECGEFRRTRHAVLQTYNRATWRSVYSVC